MRPKSLALLLLALGCGLVASIGITEVIARRNVDPSAFAGNTMPVFVAMTDIGLGDLVTPQVLKVEQWPKDKVPPGALTRIEDIEGRRARTKLYAGDMILDSKLLGKGASEQGATALIPKGYRVVPVKVDMVSGGSSLILPGDRVDVMVHLIRDPARDIPETVTRTILQDIKVFAVNDVVDLEKDVASGKTIAAKTISLLVTPEQAAKVMLATQMGTINLVMRSSEDDQVSQNVQARPAELLGNLSKTAREKESLVEEPKEDLSEKTKGFLDFLNSMKQKIETAPTDSTETKPQDIWTMRLLKPGEVEEVQFQGGEVQSPSAASSRVLKTAAIPADTAASQAADKTQKMITPSVQETLDDAVPPEPLPAVESPNRNRDDSDSRR